MKNILIIAIAAGVVVAIAATILFTARAGPTSAQQTDESAPFDMITDRDGNDVPDDFENAYRELMEPTADGDFDLAAMERFEDRIPLNEETRRLRDQIDAKTQELMSATSEARQIELLKEIQELSDRMVENDPVHSATLEYLERIESQDADME